VFESQLPGGNRTALLTKTNCLELIMDGMNITTQQEVVPRYVQSPDIGVPIQIPVTRLEEVALILRAVIALSDMELYQSIELDRLMLNNQVPHTGR
jgi:hypothetical protein